MTIDLADILKTLRSERADALKQVERLDKAITSLRQLSGATSMSSPNGHARKLSVSGRRRIAAAQKARWSKFRKEQKAKG